MFDDSTYDILTGKREDVVRRTDEGLKLAARTVLLDQAALGAPYLNVFMYQPTFAVERAFRYRDAHSRFGRAPSVSRTDG